MDLSWEEWRLSSLAQRILCQVVMLDDFMFTAFLRDLLRLFFMCSFSELLAFRLGNGYSLGLFLSHSTFAALGLGPGEKGQGSLPLSSNLFGFASITGSLCAMDSAFFLQQILP